MCPLWTHSCLGTGSPSSGCHFSAATLPGVTKRVNRSRLRMPRV